MLYLSAFCVLSFSSEALGFSAGNICVVTVTVFAVFNPTFLVYTRYVHFSCFLLVVFVLWFVVGLFGRVALRLGVGMWLLGLFQGVLTVLRVSVAPLCLLWAIDSSLG